VDKLKEIIVGAIPVEQICLFGSHAYGTPRKDSDMDFYVALKDEAQMRDLDAGLQIRLVIVRLPGGLSVFSLARRGVIESQGGVCCSQKVVAF